MAWKGNLYAKQDPQKASEYYTMALEKNPYHPNWIRAFADMLYENKDYENALYLYDKYLDAIPDFWKWKDNLDEHKQNSYKTFLKNTPYFWGIIEKMNNINSILKNR
ncbi:tetratricopeptide repeat protein [Candidatus Peregrinibacteria bacterium]|nr:tetratricopeptide repeat protein [Candidatus Peregrinibacteria bacterium]